MGYLHIDNLYKRPDILELGRLYAMEKIHGTSAHIRFRDGKLTFFSGGVQHHDFVPIFNGSYLETAMASFGFNDITVFGEAYGGKCQGMRHVYGDELRFVAFDVKANNDWLIVPLADALVKFLKLDFVDYVQISSTMEAIDAERDKPSTQAKKNGMGDNHIREGVVLRPLIELVDERGNRIIAKHKRPEFSEVKTPRKVSSDELKKIKAGEAVAEEYVTQMRLQHVLDRAQAAINAVKGLDGNKNLDITDTKYVIDMMVEDIYREAKGEIEESKEVSDAIRRRSAGMYKKWLVSALYKPE